MAIEQRISWKPNGLKVYEAYNSKNELLGHLAYEKVGAHMHWCWYQESDIRMSPGCLQEVRDKQKEFWKEEST